MLLLAAGVVAVLLSSLTPARAATTGQLKQRISAGQGQVSALAGQVGAASRRVNRLGQSVATLTGEVNRLQTDLTAKRLELLRLRSELAAARARLLRLEAAEAHAQLVLSQQLVGSYESDRPDIVSVVLESTGFSNLLERLAFAQRIRHQDAQITGRVKAARRAVAAQATRLGALSLRQQRLTTQVLAERNRVDGARLAIVQQQIAAIHVRDSRAGRLQTRPRAARCAAPSAQPPDRGPGRGGGRAGPGAGGAERPARSERLERLGSGPECAVRARLQRRLHLPDAQGLSLTPGHLVTGRRSRYLRARRHSALRGLLGHRRAARDRRLRSLGAGHPL